MVAGLAPVVLQGEGGWRTSDVKRAAVFPSPVATGTFGIAAGMAQIKTGRRGCRALLLYHVKFRVKRVVII